MRIPRLRPVYLLIYLARRTRRKRRKSRGKKKTKGWSNHEKMPDSTNGQKGEASRCVSGVLKESITASIFVLFFLTKYLVAISRRWGSITRAQGVSDQSKRNAIRIRFICDEILSESLVLSV